MKGIICSWNEKKGFGFIKPELSNIHQYFFHVSKVHSARQAIKLNAQVTFDIEKTNKMTKQRDPKLAAKNVVIIGASTATATLKLIAIYSGLPMLLLSKWLWFAPLVFAYYCLISLITFLVTRWISQKHCRGNGGSQNQHCIYLNYSVVGLGRWLRSESFGIKLEKPAIK